MKTTVELNDSLLEEIKRHATQHHTTLRVVLERALKHFPQRRSTTPFRMRYAIFSGSGLHAGIQEEDWSPIRALVGISQRRSAPATCRNESMVTQGRQGSADWNPDQYFRRQPPPDDRDPRARQRAGTVKSDGPR
ncbi:MAG: hypothetical protein IPM89_09280 [Candidatus Competibacteraceae bacterium]|nr:MAG: hypothetical protein IPM89_09280 [Candidatus Competibacteraceae bacterium]